VADQVRIADASILPRFAYALGRHVDALGDAGRDARARARRVAQQLADAVAAHRRVVLALEDLLVACEDDERGAISRRLADARIELQVAERAMREVVAAREELERVIARQQNNLERCAQRGVTWLADVYDRLSQARDAFAAAIAALSHAAGGASARSATASTATSHAWESLGDAGHVLVPLASIDDADSAVTGAQSFEHLSYGDATAALARLPVVLDAVRTGDARSVLAAIDTTQGLSGSAASYVRTFEGFFGSTSIELRRQPGRALEVVNGYHRIWAARAAGMSSIPARVRP
jgi:hypothetical protein